MLVVLATAASVVSKKWKGEGGGMQACTASRKREPTGRHARASSQEP